jgi:hypothetical protein
MARPRTAMAAIEMVKVFMIKGATSVGLGYLMRKGMDVLGSAVR